MKTVAQQQNKEKIRRGKGVPKVPPPPQKSYVLFV